MIRRPQAVLLPDGRRLHLQDGPIDLIIEGWGERAAVEAAYRAALAALTGLLDRLCAELPLLRRPWSAEAPAALEPVARRMQAAIAPFGPALFITPMAAVAGAVADHVLAAMVAAAPLTKAYVNNGGDIALHLMAGQRFAIGLIDRPDHPALFGRSEVVGGQGIGGIATSGRHGRSFSFGIADAVTVLAADAAAADAAATVIANAVDLPGHPGIGRCPADQLQPDSDLGSRLVTRTVPPLSPVEIEFALAGGLIAADDLGRRRLIVGAALHLQGVTRIAGPAPAVTALAPLPFTPGAALPSAVPGP